MQIARKRLTERRHGLVACKLSFVLFLVCTWIHLHVWQKNLLVCCVSTRQEIGIGSNRSNNFNKFADSL